jgi:2,4-dienoyl-CoA reductase-like NADH-dependent reductase (Old Yellow Enzyme family)
MAMTNLFDQITLRDVSMRNRLVLSPMCQYQAKDGYANDFHLAHYGKFALGGFGVVMLEATGVSPEGRITHGDLGLWDDSHIPGLSRITTFLKENGAIPAVQLGHAGAKASTQRPYDGNGALTAIDHERGDIAWEVVAPTAMPFEDGWLMPRALDNAGMAKVRSDFTNATRRALEAGFDIIELHSAHGYLLHSFLSPLKNSRTDEYGGNLENRMRLPLEVVSEMRAIWPDDKPFFVRISSIDGVSVGTSIDDSIVFAKRLAALGVDVIDCSSGGIIRYYERPTERPGGYGFQVPYAQEIGKAVDVKTMAVGLIVNPMQANAIVSTGKADLVAIGREALFNPNFAYHAKRALASADVRGSYDDWPKQYGWWLEIRQRKLETIGDWLPADESPV